MVIWMCPAVINIIIICSRYSLQGDFNLQQLYLWRIITKPDEHEFDALFPDKTVLMVVCLQVCIQSFNSMALVHSGTHPTSPNASCWRIKWLQSSETHPTVQEVRAVILHHCNFIMKVCSSVATVLLPCTFTHIYTLDHKRLQILTFLQPCHTECMRTSTAVQSSYCGDFTELFLYVKCMHRMYHCADISQLV